MNIVNNPGASGELGAIAAARANKDGYTVFVAVSGLLASMTRGNPKTPVVLLRDLDPIATYKDYASGLVVIDRRLEVLILKQFSIFRQRSWWALRRRLRTLEKGVAISARGAVLKG